MWGLLVQLGIWAVLYVGNKLLTPKPKTKPLTRENLELPRTEEGTPLPYVFGRTRVQSPVLIFNGDLQTKTVDNSNNGAQYNVYAVDLLFCIGIPMGSGVTRGNSLAGPRLHNVWMGDQKMPAPVMGSLPAAGKTSLYYSQMVFRPHALGGPGNGGGLIGAYTFFGGWTDQNLVSPASRMGDVMTTKIGDASLIPGWRRQMLIGFHKYPKDSSDSYWNQTGQDGGSGTHESVPYPDQGFILGEMPNVDGISVEVSAYGDSATGAGSFGLNGGNPGVDYGGDADPAEVVYDLLTNPWARAGQPPSKLDVSSFLASSGTLKSENHGCSGVIYDAAEVAQTIQSLLRQMNAALYEEPTTGLLTLKLIRNDFNPLTAPAFDMDSIVEISDFGVGGFKDTVNEVRVSYTDRSAEYKPGIAVAQSLANAVGNSNRRRSRTVEYPFCTNAALAASLAARDLNALSRPLARIKITLNRTAHSLRPGTVFKVTYPKYTALANGMFFRVRSVDLGQLFDNKVTIDAVQDPFTTTYTGLGFDWSPPSRRFPHPLWDRTITEAPYWLAREASTSGLIADPDLAHLLPMPRPSLNATQFAMSTKADIINKQTLLLQDWQTDVPLSDFPGEFRVATAYARELEPYDTTTGLVIEALTGIPLKLLNNFYGTIFGSGTTIFNATTAQIQDEGRNLVCLITSSGAMEFIAFESMTSLGSGRYRLNNVWRGLLDTPAIAHAAGERGVFIHPNMVSRRAWNVSRRVHVWMTPRAPHINGSGEDPEDFYFGQFLANGYYGAQIIAARAARPLPQADLGVGNDGVQTTGTLAPTAGTPAVAGYYKLLPLLEEGADITFKTRDRNNPKILKGSDPAEAYTDFSASAPGIHAVVVAAKRGEYLPLGDNNGPSYLNAYDGVDFESINPTRGWKIDGYGWIDITNGATVFLKEGDPRIGRGGIQPFTTYFPWDNPRVTAFMPAWRNLLPNPRFTYGATELRPWSATSGTATLQSGAANDIHQLASARWLQGSSASFTYSGFIQIKRWKPRGMTALFLAYARNFNADTDDTAQVQIAAGQMGVGTLATATSVAAAPNANYWKPFYISVPLPANTDSLTPALIGTNAGAGGTANADVGWTEPDLRIGQWVAVPVGYGGGLATTFANASFEAGTTASWTVASGVWNVVGGFQSAFCATSTALANASIWQEYTLPVGGEYGSTAIVTFWCGQLSNVNSTLTGKLEAMDAGSNVLATCTTGNFSVSGNNVYAKKTLFLALPDGATKVRFTFSSNYISGASKTDVLDEVNLYIVKDRDPRVTRTLDFSAPSSQTMPATWQQFSRFLPTANERFTSFVRGYPRSPQQINFTFGNGALFSAGWLFDELAAPCASEFAQPPGSSSTSYPLAVSGTSPTFMLDGPKGAPDRAIRLVNNTDALSGGNILNAGTGDLIGCCTVYIESIAGNNDLAGKGYTGGGALPGWLLCRETNSIALYVSDGVTPLRAGAAGITAGQWYSVVFIASRSNNSVGIAVVPLTGASSANVLTGGVTGFAALGSITNALNFKIGDQSIYRAGNAQISSFYLGAGAGVGGTLTNNVAAPSKSFAAAVNGSLTVPDYVFGGTDFNGEQIEWIDGIAHASAKVVGQLGNGVTSVDGYQFTRGAGAAWPHAAAKWSTKSTVGNFKLTDPFTAVVFYRADEPGFSTLAGLFGRMDLTAGWGLSISAAGQVTALLRGAGATSKSVSTGRVASEGGLHMAAIVNDPGTQLLWVYDELGGVSVLTSSGLGAIDRVAQACHLRIGRDVDDHDVLPGQIARAYLWRSALSSAEIRALWNYAQDPTNKITTYTRTAAAWSFGPSDSAGATAYAIGSTQVAVPYFTALAADNGTGFGLAIGRSCANLLPDATFTSANWALDAGAGRTTGIVGPTGNPRAAQFSGSAAASVYAQNIPLAASPTTVTVVFMARLISGGPNLTLKLRNSASVLKSTAAAVVLTSLWQRFVVALPSWDGSTPTGKVEFNPSSGATVFELAEVMCISQGTEIPALLPMPASTHGDYNATIDATKTYDMDLPVQFNSEGEVIAQGTSMNNPSANGTLVQVSNATNANNRRELMAVNTPGIRCVHYDSAAVSVDCNLGYANWTRVWRVVGRWNRQSLIDASGGTAENAKAAYTDHLTPANQLGTVGRNATWTINTTVSTLFKLGAGISAPVDTVLRKVIIQTREEKYD